MTKTTEELKREMYDAFLEVSKYSGCGTLLDLFESRLEAYLEALRKAMVTINESTVSCAQHSAEAFLDLEGRLDRMTEERDQLRNKLQAFEFANRSAAELLSEALREPSELRKSAGSTSAQSEAGNFSIIAMDIEPINLEGYLCGDPKKTNVVPIFKLIRDKTEYELTPEQFDAFESVLMNNPASENKSLQELLARNPSWTGEKK